MGSYEENRFMGPMIDESLRLFPRSLEKGNKFDSENFNNLKIAFQEIRELHAFEDNFFIFHFYCLHTVQHTSRRMFHIQLIDRLHMFLHFQY